jgi:glycosyltransferase involved in cell wall biosynthesis
MNSVFRIYFNMRRFIGSVRLLFRRSYKPTLFVDVSLVDLNDLGTGIQRVVRSICLSLLEIDKQDFSIVPCVLKSRGIYFASRFIERYNLDLRFPHLAERNCLPKRGDTYLMADLALEAVVTAQKRGFWDFLKDIGVVRVFLIYDNIPIDFPEYFESGARQAHYDWLKAVFSAADLIICISNTVAESTLAIHSDMRAKGQVSTPFPDCCIVKLGSDIRSFSPVPPCLVYERLVPIFESAEPVFLMLGTIEPRKGHRCVLDAFDYLWGKGLHAKLLIVGRPGWMVDDLTSRILRHPAIEHRLFWLSDCADDELVAVLGRVDCLIAASYAEGFGLPIVEAAEFGIPIIARDIQVFKEVAGNSAYYFTDDSSLVFTIEKWLIDWQEGGLAETTPMTLISWRECCLKIIAALEQHRTH